MATFLLAIYTALILIRPMDWWAPVLEWQLVTVTAIMSIFAAFPRFMEEGPQQWNSQPAVKMAGFWVIGASLSLLPIFWFGGMKQVFEEMGKIFVYYFLIILLCRNRQGYRIILWTVLGCTIWMAIHAWLQHSRGFGFGNVPPFWRVRDRETGEGVWQAVAFGTFEDPNDLCLIFIITIPLLYAEFRSHPNSIVKGIALLAIPLVGYGVWLTNSRGGYLGIFAMVAAFVSSRTKGFKRWVLIGFSVFFLTTFAPSRFAAGFVGQQDRSILWGDGIAMFKAHPFFGVGFYEFQTYSSERKVAHNTYVHVLAETGMVGYLPFFGMVFFSFFHLRRAMNLGPLLERVDAIQLAGLFSAAVGYFTSIYFLSRQKTHLPYIILALMTVKTIGVCRTPEMFAQVFLQNPKEYRKAVIWGLGSIVFMWVTIRVVNATG